LEKTLAIIEEAAQKLLRIWKIPPWNRRPHGIELISLHFLGAEYEPECSQWPDYFL
jgi:hypothetical protein